MPLRAKGFTVVELIFALGLLAVVMTAAGRLLLNQGRFYRELGQHADLDDELRAGAEILAGDLWGLDAREGDILAFGSDSIRIRAQRVFSIVCGTAGGSLLLRKVLTFGVRDAGAGDSVLVYAGADSGWKAGVVTSGPASASCPDSTLAQRVAVSFAGPLPSVGAPLIAYEVVTYRSYRASDGAYYLGLRDAGTLQPLAGPLAPAGLLLTFFDSTGAPARAARDVNAIRIRLRLLSAEPFTRRGVTALLDDSVVSWVTLRNNLR